MSDKEAKLPTRLVPHRSSAYVNRRKYDAEFKKNAVKLSYASPKTIKEVADDLGVSESMLYRWRQRYTAQGEKTQTATLEEELKALRLECSELRIERDMLKKAAAYFAKLQNDGDVSGNYGDLDFWIVKLKPEL